MSTRRLRSASGLALAALLAIVLVVALAGCGTTTTTAGGTTPTDATTTASTGTAATGEPILIGCIGALSGPGADTTISLQGGVELAIDEINAAGGINNRPLKSIWVDDTLDPATAVTAAQRLVTKDGVVAVLGGSHSNTAMAIKAVAESQKFIDISPIGVTFKLTADHPKYLYRVCAVDQMSSKYQVQDFVAKKGYKAPALIHDTSALGMGAKATYTAALEAAGITPVADLTFEQGTTDLTTQVLTAKQKGADIILFGGIGADAGTLGKAIKQLDWKIQVIGHDSITMMSAMRLAADALEGSIAWTAGDASDPKLKEYYVTKFEAKYGKPSELPVGVGQGYDAIQVLAEALRTAKSTGTEDLRAALDKITNLPSLTLDGRGYISFTPQDHDGFHGINGANYGVFVIANSGQWVKYTE